MIVAIVGTGTGVGKTTVTAAWARASTRKLLAWKAIETGGDDDSRALASSCGRAFPPAYSFAPPVSPHLAARRAGVPIELDVVEAKARAIAAEGTVLMETAGGLFSPFDDATSTNAELVERVANRVVLVAPDRLGVLHDVEAALRACHELRVDAIVLSNVGALDESVGTNASELRARRSIPVVELFGRAFEPAALASLERVVFG